MRYRVGTRGSKLALVQTKQVIEKLKTTFPEDEFDDQCRIKCVHNGIIFK